MAGLEFRSSNFAISPSTTQCQLSTQIRDLSCLVAARVFVYVNPRRKYGPFKKFEVLTAMLSQPQGLWNVTPCRLGKWRSNFLQRDGNYLPIGVTSHSRTRVGLRANS